VDQEEAIPDVKYPDADDHPDAAEAARERYDTLGAIGKEAAPEAIEAQLDDVMDVDGYLSWLAFNTLVRNGGTLLISPEGAEGGESDVSVWLRVACCVLSRKSQPPQGPLGLVPSLPGEAPGGADSSDEVYFYASRGLGGKWFWRSMAWDMVRFRRCLCLEIVAS